jgi:alanine dehydrogenase
MKVGVPKEIKTLEFRVGMTPAGVRELVHDGHEVVVETNAGIGIGMTDVDYEAAGAKVVDTAEEVFAAAEMIPKQTEALVKSGTTAIAYETVTAKDGSLPLLTPMSEVAGRLSIQAGAFALQKANGGRGVLLGGVPGVKPGKVVIIGGGVSGMNAADMAIGLGADVTVLDRSLPRLREIEFTRSTRPSTPSTNWFRRPISWLVPCWSPVRRHRSWCRSKTSRTCTVAPYSSTFPSTRAAASKRAGRPRMPNRPISCTTACTIASPTCRARCRVPARSH